MTGRARVTQEREHILYRHEIAEMPVGTFFCAFIKMRLFDFTFRPVVFQPRNKIITSRFERGHKLRV